MTTLHELFGRDEQGGRWTRPGAVLLAYVMAHLVSTSLETLMEADRSPDAVIVAQVQWWGLFRLLLLGLVFAGVSAVVLRRTGRPLVASATIAFTYMLLTAPIFRLHELIGVDNGQLIRQLVAVRFAWPFALLVALHVGLPRIRSVTLALFAAAVGARVVQEGFYLLWYSSTIDNASLDVRSQLMSLAQGVCWAGIFAVVLGALLRALEVPQRRLAVLPILAWALGCLTIGGSLATIGTLFAERGSLNQAIFISWGFLAAGAAGFLLIVHRAWSALPPSDRRMTPRAAVVRMFIPGYNVYWAFHVLPGFATDYNRWLSVNDPAERRIPVIVFVAYLILSFMAAIPRAGVYIATLNIVLGAYILAELCRAANRLGNAASVSA